MTENANISFEEFLSSETAKVKKRTKLSIILGGLICIILLAYFSWLNSILKSILEPENLAFTIHGQMLHMWPKVKTQVEEELIKSAPEVTSKTIEQLIAAIPQIRTTLQAEIDKRAKKYIEIINDKLNIAVADIIKEHKDELNEHSERLEDLAFVETLVKDAEKDLAREFDSILLAQSGKSLSEHVDQSLIYLKAVDEQLRTLATSEKLTPQQEREKHLVLALLGLVKEIQE